MSQKSIILTVLALVVLGAGLYLTMRNNNGTPIVPNNNGVVTDPNNTGNPVATSTPVQHSMIRVTSPQTNAIVGSPLTITGEARGGWYFEASFPVKILDANGKVLGQHYAEAQGEWMTNNFVPFKATLTFTKPTTSTGTLVLEKDNPSGLPENADEIRIPIRFSNAASNTPIQDAIRALLADWNLPGVTLDAASLNNGVLTLTFSDPQFQTSGGSARVLDMRAQIEATAKQFAGVNSVRLMPNSVFQP